MLGELDPRKIRLRAAAGYEGTAVDPHHHRQLCRRRGRGWSPDIDEQAIFRRGRRDRRRAAWTGGLRTIRAELARVSFSLPRGHGLCRTPTIGADRRGSIGNPLEAGDIPFRPAAHNSGGGTNRRRRGRGRLLWPTLFGVLRAC